MLLLVGLPAACGGDNGDANPSTALATGVPAIPSPTPGGSTEGIGSLTALRDAGAWRAEGADEIEVWICHVPADSTAPIYNGLPLRLPLTAAGIADILNARVTPYFDALSHGLYQPQFRAGGEATLAADQEPQLCVDQAIVGADDTTDAVLVVADAEHRPEFPGGFGNPGVPCPAEPPCPVLDSRRSAYVGASDFHPDWGDQPPMDLVEHELGHAVGWTHSGFVDGADSPYQSAIDLMSNSAAPRETDASRRDGPDTLAINRFLAGWLTVADVWVAPLAGGSVALQPSTGTTGTRLAIAPLANGSYLTVESLTADGFNSHLPAGGIAVHRVVMTAEGAVQVIVPLVGEAPFTDLLQPDEFVESDGWRIAVSDGIVTITPVV
ncbi:MAG: hypothetical protein K8R99_06250 [Actinomycetia bacterium]|nr:hypothetical protein [Actinomycetes bacterium]